MVVSRLFFRTHLTTRKGDRRGFTIVELLIVVVVIAVLAAISVVAYNGIVKRADVAALKTEVREAVNQIEISKIDNGDYPVNLDESNYQLNEALVYEYTQYGPVEFCITVTSNKAMTSYYYDSYLGDIQEGACDDHVGYDPDGESGGSGAITASVNNMYGAKFEIETSQIDPNTVAIKVVCTGTGWDGDMGFDFTGLTRTDMRPLEAGIAWADYSDMSDLVGYDWTQDPTVIAGFEAVFAESEFDLSDTEYRPNARIPMGNSYSCLLETLDINQNVLQQMPAVTVTPDFVT